ncbi:MAG TPA: addiction module antitoxin [Candidatus Aminicenantes bacterium]|nr:addiction module antitoxin [Candidatus Aminicenantes bacterium]
MDKFKKLTITVERPVYEGLHRLIGRGRISAFLNNLARPYVVEEELEKAYTEMARDERREAEALEWSENLVPELQDETR